MFIPYNVLIIGAGKIGALFDDPESSDILTHAHAFSEHKKFNLLGFVDTDINKSINAAKRWNCNYFCSIEKVFANNRIDIVCVAVPDEYHYEVLKRISTFSPKFVFAEKPLTKTLEETKNIIAIYKQKKIPILVNYTRRFVPELIALKEALDNKMFGGFVGGVGYYGKGILHNGSHMVDLLRYLIGEITEVESLSYNFDFYSDDPSVSSILTFNNNSKFFMKDVDCSLYSVFELDLLFEKKRVRIIDLGFKIEIYEVYENEVFKGYKKLKKVEEIETSLGKALSFVVENISDFLEKKVELKCCVNDAYKAMQICLELKEKALKCKKKFYYSQEIPGEQTL